MNLVLTSVILALVSLVSRPSLSMAQSCDSQLQELKTKLDRKYSIEKRREELLDLRSRMSRQETAELIDLAQKFKSALPGTNPNTDERYALQNAARILVRSIARSQGYRLLDPEQGSYYDALISEFPSSDGFTEYVVEIRSLLIRQDPLPRMTIWAYRWDPSHNPWKMISIDIMPASDQDFASWRGPNGGRILGSMDEFLKANLPAECQ